MSSVNFENTAVAFQHKNNGQLKRSFWLFKLIASPRLVKLGGALTNLAVGLGVPIGWAIKKNIFSQFCGGVNISESKKAAHHLAKSGIGSILDYSVEGKENEKDFDFTADEIKRTVDAAENNNDIPFSVFKVTGICRFSLLEKVNAKQALSTNEELEWERAVGRVFSICEHAHKKNVSLFIDAEDSWIQDAIDELTEDMMVQFNQKDFIVYNTVQLYRHDRLAYLKAMHARLKEKGAKTAVKLVRGAYMEKERKRAAEMGYLDPIQSSKENTDRDFNLAVDYCLDHIEDIAICCGSHNEESSAMLVEKMNARGIASNDKRIYFAQLFGMSDHISYNLSHANYNVAKYLPYGPIKEVMPYLLRRAQENTSVKGQTGRELSLIQREIQRRKKA